MFPFRSDYFIYAIILQHSLSFLDASLFGETGNQFQVPKSTKLQALIGHLIAGVVWNLNHVLCFYVFILQFFHGLVHFFFHCGVNDYNV